MPKHADRRLSPARRDRAMFASLPSTLVLASIRRLRASWQFTAVFFAAAISPSTQSLSDMYLSPRTGAAQRILFFLLDSLLITLILAVNVHKGIRQILNPYPFIHSRYFPTRLLHSSCGSSLREKSMHSSREAFSGWQTQQG